MDNLRGEITINGAAAGGVGGLDGVSPGLGQDDISSLEHWEQAVQKRLSGFF